MITLAIWDPRPIVKNIILVVLFSCGAIGCVVGAIICASTEGLDPSGWLYGLAFTGVIDIFCIFFLCKNVRLNNRYIPPIFIDEETNKLCFFTGKYFYEIEDQNYEITIVGKNKSFIPLSFVLSGFISIEKDVYGSLKIFLSSDKEQKYFTIKLKNIFIADEIDIKVTKLLSLRKDCYENRLDSLDAAGKKIRLARIADAIKEFDYITEKNSKQIFFME